MLHEETGATKTIEEFGSITREKSTELAAMAVAAAAEAEVKSAYVMALRKPRNAENARIAMLNICKNPMFAEKAIYKKPVGGTTITGPSIRFAEEMLRHWQNVKTMHTCIYEDSDKRIIKITVIDLESNISYSKEVTIDKTVERREPRGREVLFERRNTKNQIIYVVKATEDELQIKEAAFASKLIRNNGLRLIPEHIIEEAVRVAHESMASRVNKDPESEKRRIFDAFNELGIRPSDLEKYLRHSLSQMTSKELIDLRQVYAAIKEGAAIWSDYVATENDKNNDLEIPTKPEPAKKGKAKKEESASTKKENSDIPKKDVLASKNQKNMLEKIVAGIGIKDGDYLDWLKEENIKDPSKLTQSQYTQLIEKAARLADEQEKAQG